MGGGSGYHHQEPVKREVCVHALVLLSGSCPPPPLRMQRGFKCKDSLNATTPSPSLSGLSLGLLLLLLLSREADSRGMRCLNCVVRLLLIGPAGFTPRPSFTHFSRHPAQHTERQRSDQRSDQRSACICLVEEGLALWRMDGRSCVCVGGGGSGPMSAAVITTFNLPKASVCGGDESCVVHHEARVL